MMPWSIEELAAQPGRLLAGSLVSDRVVLGVSLELMHKELCVLSGGILIHMDAVEAGVQLQFESIARGLARGSSIHEDQWRLDNLDGNRFQGSAHVDGNHGDDGTQHSIG
jgi:hypothetical protein